MPHTKTSLDILLVDDDQLTRRAAAKILTDWGHKVSEAGSAPEAMAILNGRPQEFQVVLTDWRMPHVSGLELCRWMRKSELLCNIYVVVITGATGEEHIEALKAGADAFVTKSFELEELKLTLRVPQRIKLLEERLQSELKRVERTNERLTESYNDLLEARAEAERANRAKDTFLANMSHEIRTPMTGVIGLAQLLLEDETLEGGHRDSVKSIYQCATDLLDIINKVLDFSKLASGNTEVVEKEFSLRELLDKVVLPFQGLAIQSDLFIGVSLPSTVPDTWVGTDPSLLRQILINLMGNATKFTSEGHVVLCCRRADNGLVFEVRDTGPGIPNEARDKIFREFQQADESFAKPTDGTGLGLAISSELSKLLGGQLELAETGPEGSCFRFTLPAQTPPDRSRSADYRALSLCDLSARDLSLAELVVDPEHSERQAQARLHKRDDQWFVETDGGGTEALTGVLRTWGLHKKEPAREAGDESSNHPEERKFLGRLILAEDNPVNGRVMSIFLEKAGYRVDWKTDGLSVVEMQLSDPHDLILMDLQMPGLDGLQATERIRNEEAARGRAPVPIIALTARSTIADRDPRQTSLLSDFLVKPVSNEDLFKKIEEHLLQARESKT